MYRRVIYQVRWSRRLSNPCLEAANVPQRVSFMRIATPGLRDRIADAAGQLFAVQRFHEVRMEDIAAEANVSKGTLYRYFADKEDLYFGLIATGSERLLEQFEQAVDPAFDARTNLCRIVESMIAFFDRHTYFFDLLQRVESMDTSGREFPWIKTRVLIWDFISQWIEACNPAVGETSADPHLHSLLLLGAVRASIRFGKRPRQENLAEVIVDTFLFGLMPR